MNQNFGNTAVNNDNIMYMANTTTILSKVFHKAFAGQVQSVSILITNNYNVADFHLKIALYDYLGNRVSTFNTIVVPAGTVNTVFTAGRETGNDLPIGDYHFGMILLDAFADGIYFGYNVDVSQEYIDGSWVDYAHGAPPATVVLTPWVTNQNWCIFATYSVTGETTGSLNITSTESGAEAFVNGVSQGIIPTDGRITLTDLLTGDYTVRVTLNGFVPFEQIVNIIGDVKTVNAVLIPYTGIEYFVSPSGDDTNPGSFALPFLTPQFASDLLQPGDILTFRGGTYNNATVWNLNRSGNEGARCTMRNYASEVVNIVLRRQAQTYGWQGFDTNFQSYFNIIGINFIGADGAVIDYAPSLPTWKPAYGVYPNNSHHFLIKDCKMSRTAYDGLYPYRCHDFVLDNVETFDAPMSNNGEECLSIVESHDFEAMNCKIHDPIGNQRLGLNVKQGGYNGKIHHNEIYNLKGQWQGGIVIGGLGGDTHDIDVYANVAHDIPQGCAWAVTDEAGIWALYKIKVHDNVSYNCGWGLFGVTNGLDSTPHTSHFDDVRFENNTSFNDGYNTDRTVSILSFWNLNPDYANGIIVRNNIIVVKSPIKVIPILDNTFVLAAGKLLVDHNLWLNTGAGWLISADGYLMSADDFQGDPKFVNAEAHDFHLKADSPAINAGSADAISEADFDDVARPQGAQFDIGAYEYVGTPVPPPSGNNIGLVALGALALLAFISRRKK